jgi:hypothetical protein
MVSETNVFMADRNTGIIPLHRCSGALIENLLAREARIARG